MRRMLFTAALVATSGALAIAQQAPPPPVSLAELQKEAAAAVQGTTVPTPPPVTPVTSATPTIPTAGAPPAPGNAATMTPVAIKTVDQLGMEVDSAYEKMKSAFNDLSTRINDVRTPEEANTLTSNAHESLRRYTEAARRYYAQLQAQRQADLDSDRNRVTAREDEARRIESDIKRARDEANTYGTQLDTAQQAAVSMASNPQ